MTSTAATRRRRPLPTALVLLAGLLLTGAAYSALGGGSRAQALDTATTQQVDEGKRLFAVGCSSCHGLNAEGSAKGPSLIGVGAASVHFQVSSGRMPLAQNGPQAERKAPRYSEEETADLAAYIQSLGGGPTIPSAELLAGVSDADLAAGGELFRTNCSSCHNFVGRGGALTHGKYAPSLHEASATQIYEAMVTGPENMPVFSETQLTPQDKLNIIKYVEHVESQVDPGGFGLGRVGPVPEFLVALLVGVLGCVIFCLWIGART